MGTTIVTGSGTLKATLIDACRGGALVIWVESLGYQGVRIIGQEGIHAKESVLLPLMLT